MNKALSVNNLLYDQVIPQLPKKWMSHALGAMAHWRLPQGVSQKLIASFASYYGIDLNEIEKPVSEYRTLGEFFSRALKEGMRPIQGEIVHPCDSVLIQSGRVYEDSLIQAKGKSFSLDKFIPDNPWSGDFREGSFFTYYLAPHNYHRVHSPITGKIKWSTVLPGELWPVNSWSVRNIDGLYAVNERVATGIETDRGRVIMVMVGATNVGRMSFTFDPNISTNRPGKKEKVHRAYSEGRDIAVGEEFGTFHLGSTVVVLYSKSFDFHHQGRKAVLMGQRFLS